MGRRSNAQIARERAQYDAEAKLLTVALQLAHLVEDTYRLYPSATWCLSSPAFTALLAAAKHYSALTQPEEPPRNAAEPRAAS